MLAGRYLDYVVINLLSLGIGKLVSGDRFPLHIGEPVVAYFKDRIFYPIDAGKMITRSLRSSAPLVLFGGEEYFRQI